MKVARHKSITMYVVFPWIIFMFQGRMYKSLTVRGARRKIDDIWKNYDETHGTSYGAVDDQ